MIHPHEHKPLRIGTASFPRNVSYHSRQSTLPSTSLGPSTYQVPHIAHVSSHLCCSSACNALFRRYSGNSHALSMSTRIKLFARVRDVNSTSDGTWERSAGG